MNNEMHTVAVVNSSGNVYSGGLQQCYNIQVDINIIELWLITIIITAEVGVRQGYGSSGIHDPRPGRSHDPWEPRNLKGEKAQRLRASKLQQWDMNDTGGEEEEEEKLSVSFVPQQSRPVAA